MFRVCAILAANAAKIGFTDTMNPHSDRPVLISAPGGFFMAVPAAGNEFD